jgi:hypothetical protein
MNAAHEDFYFFAVRQISRRRSLRCEAWPPGLLIDLAKAAGITFSDDRKTGPVFEQLRRDGFIRRAGLFPRASSNGSMRPGWIGI